MFGDLKELQILNYWDEDSGIVSPFGIVNNTTATAHVYNSENNKKKFLHIVSN